MNAFYNHINSGKGNFKAHTPKHQQTNIVQAKEKFYMEERVIFSIITSAYDKLNMDKMVRG